MLGVVLLSSFEDDKWWNRPALRIYCDDSGNPLSIA
jgi:hypothetical protein